MFRQPRQFSLQPVMPRGEPEISIIPAPDTAFSVARIFLVPRQKLSVVRLISRLPAQNKVQINGSMRAVDQAPERLEKYDDYPY
jgi:hypothetical protein